MSWITIILAVLQALPQLITLIKGIIEIIQNIPSKAERRVAIRELKQAIREAKATGSSKPLEMLKTKLSNEA